MRKLRVCGRTVEQYGGFALTCNSKDAESPCVFARASKFANAFIRENSAAFDDLQVAIDEALGALIEDSLGASGLSLKTKRVKEWAFAYAEAHLYLPKRTPLSEHVHFDGGTGQLHMALSVASCRQLSVVDTRGRPHNFVLQPSTGTAYLTTTSAFEHSVFTPCKQRVCGTSCVQGRFPSELRTGLFNFAPTLCLPARRSPSTTHTVSCWS